MIMYVHIVLKKVKWVIYKNGTNVDGISLHYNF